MKLDLNWLHCFYRSSVGNEQEQKSLFRVFQSITVQFFMGRPPQHKVNPFRGHSSMMRGFYRSLILWHCLVNGESNSTLKTINRIRYFNNVSYLISFYIITFLYPCKQARCWIAGREMNSYNVSKNTYVHFLYFLW